MILKKYIHHYPGGIVLYNFGVDNNNNNKYNINKYPKGIGYTKSHEEIFYYLDDIYFFYGKTFLTSYSLDYGIHTNNTNLGIYEIKFTFNKVYIKSLFD